MAQRGRPKKKTDDEQSIERLEGNYVVPKTFEKATPEEAARLKKGTFALYKLTADFKPREFKTREELVDLIEKYMEVCEEKELYPTENGLMLYLGISIPMYYAYMKAGDWRGEIFGMFRRLVSESVNQAGLHGESDRVFSIYYLKSKMQEYDQPSQININLNVGNQATMSTNEMMDIINNGMKMDEDYIDVDYNEE